LSALHITLTAIFTLSLVATTCPAQTPSPCGVMAMGVGVYAGHASTNAPYSATIQTTHEQKFADGNSIHGLVVTHQYRDSAGRAHGETSLLCSIGTDGQMRPAFHVSVNDPVSHTSISWSVNDNAEKVARIYHQPDPKSAPAAAPSSQEQLRINQQVREHFRRNTRGEKLGTKVIAGVRTDGSREITTTPAGEQGNDQPVENMTEVWIARDTGITMLRINDDPRVGRTTTEVTDLTLAEPDPSVFSPPPGYKLVEQTTTTVPVSAAP
jgi:hypothetical protein